MEYERKTYTSVAPEHRTNGAHGLGNGHEDSLTGERTQDEVLQSLKPYEDEFLKVVNPTLNLLELKHKGVISADIKTAIESANDGDAKYILLEHLQKNATVDTLKVYCDVAIAANGFPRMQELGKKMMDALPPGEGKLTESVKGGQTLRKRPSSSKEGEGPDQAPDESVASGGVAQTEVIPKGVAVNGILLMDNSNSSNNVPVPPPEIHCSHQVASGSGQDEAAVPQDLQSKGNSSPMSRHLSSIEGKHSGWSYFQNLVTSKWIIIAFSLLSFMLAIALICYYHYHPERETYSGDYPNSQKDALSFTACQDPASCATSSTIWPSAPHNPSRSSDKQERGSPRAHGSTTIKLPRMLTDLKVISSVLFHDKVYISGIGTDDVPESRQVQVYSLKDNTWSTLPEAPNHNAPIAIVEDHITLIGGRDVKTNKPSNVIFTWDEEEKKWKQSLHSLPTVSVASKAYYHKKLFLVTGGAEESINEGEGENLTVVEKVHVYNFSSKKWTTPQQLRLPKPLCSHHLVHLGEYLYLLGGAIRFKDAAHTTPSDQIYNLNAWKARWADIEEAVQHQDLTVQPSQPEKSIWKSITDLPVFLPTVVLCGSSIISVGGMNNNGSSVSAIYEFQDDKVNSQWVKVGDMSLGRYRHGVMPLGTRGAALLVAGGFKWGVYDEADVKTTSVELVLL